jgi:putative ABC transport system permease protein
MFKNFLFVLNRFRTASLLNLAGLSVAFAVFAITMMQCWYDFSFNHNFRNSNNIFLFTNYWETFEEQNAATSIPLARLIKEKFPEVKAACVLDYQTERPFHLEGEKSGNFALVAFSRANEDFLKVFTPKILLGDAPSVFTEQNRAMLTDDAASLLFGDENPIGKTILQDTDKYVVTAVCERFPKNCSVKNGVFTSVIGSRDYNEMQWFNYSGYLLLDRKVAPSLQKKLEGLEIAEDDKIEGVKLVPCTDLYFSDLELDFPTGNLFTTLSFLAIGVITLLIALINFMNFSVAMIPSRVRGMNIRKIMGADAGSLRFLTASEAPCFAVLSFVISLIIVAWFSKSDFSSFFSAEWHI